MGLTQRPRQWELMARYKWSCVVTLDHTGMHMLNVSPDTKDVKIVS